MILLGAIFAWLLRAVMVDPVPIEVDPVPIDPFEPGSPNPGSTFDYPPPWLPEVSATEPYTGSGVQPAWDDVYKYAESQYLKPFAGGFLVSEDLRNQGALAIGQSAIGATLKAVSGFINQTVDLVQREFADLYQTLQFVLGGLDDTDKATNVRVHNLQSEVSGLAYLVAAEEQQIVALHDDIFQAAQFTLAYVQNWVTTTVTEPLLRAIVEQGQQTDVKILQASASVINHAHVDTQTQLAPVIAAAAVSTRAITALQTESDDCVKPMCETMGPNTNLGKLLKGLNLALDAAALADLLSLTAPELAEQLSAVAQKVASYVGDFESYFADGTETIGDVLGNVTGGLI